MCAGMCCIMFMILEFTNYKKIRKIKAFKSIYDVPKQPDKHTRYVQLYLPCTTHKY